MRLPRPMALAFLAGLTSSLWIQVIGYVTMVELAFAGLAPVYLYTRWRALLGGRLRPFILLALVWLGSALITDTVRGTTFGNMARGTVSIVLWIACLICQYVMLRRRLDLIKWYTVGLSLSYFISIYVFRPGSAYWLADTLGTSVESMANWRTSYSVVATTAVAAGALFGYRRYPRLIIAVLFAYAVLCLALSSRGLFLIHTVVGALAVYFYREERRAPQRRAVRVKPLVQRLRLAALIAVFGVMALAAYAFAARRGWLGVAAAARYEWQSGSNIGILSARYDFICGALAIIDSPWLGHGSWAEDTEGYRAKGLALIGLPPSLASTRLMRGGPIPGHSHIITAWVYHGILGGLYWIFVLGWLVWFAVRYLPGPREYLPYTLLTVISLSFSILASPFGQRPATAASLVFLIICAENMDRRRAAAKTTTAPAGAEASA